MLLATRRQSTPHATRAVVGPAHQGGLDNVDRGLYRTYLAMAHWQSGDHRRALEQAKQAHALLDTAGPDGKIDLDELTTWERTHR